MSAVVPRVRRAAIGRPRRISFAVIAMSIGLTGAMSLLFNHTLRLDMMTTGTVCAIVIDRVVRRISGQYRRKLAIANQTLEQRVLERTTELSDANRALRAAAALQASLRDELIVRDRMATAGELAAGVSHEIRSPLSVIRLLVDELRDRLVDASDDVTEMITDITDSTDRIGLILRDLSSIARPIDDPLGPVELAGVVDSAARLASYKLGPGAALERGQLELPPVIGNAPRLVQLVLNLMVNAARATRSDAANQIRIAGVATGDHVVLSISDTGTGMSAETRARLFEPFFTTGGDRGGTGLGLTICRTIVERMGGSIAIRSVLGEGTTVDVTLRRA